MHVVCMAGCIMTIALVCSTVPILSCMNIYSKNIKISWDLGMSESIETSDDISVATLTHHILRGSEVLNPME